MSGHDTPRTPLDLRQLRALRAVVRAGSFHQAATQLGYTQSAISQQIKALERHVGARVLERTGAGTPAVPTPVGWVLLRHADAIFAQLDQLADDLAALDRGVAGSVRVGYFQSVGATLLPRIVRQAARTMPDVELVLREAECDLVLQGQVATGELDLAFVIAPVAEEALEAAPILTDPTVLLMRADDPLCARETVSVSDVAARRIATYGLCPHQRAVEDGLRARDAAPISIRSAENATLAGIVSSGAAVGLMSRLSVVEAERSGLVAVDVPDLPPRVVAIARHRGRDLHPAALAVHDLIVSEWSGAQNDERAALADGPFGN